MFNLYNHIGKCYSEQENQEEKKKHKASREVG